MFGLFKRKLTDNEMVDALLYVWATNSEELQKLYIKQFDYKGNLSLLGFEIKIFSLWIILRSIPNPSREFKDSLHKEICKDLSSEGGKYFLDTCMQRYPKYDYVFNLWLKNPKSFRLAEALCVIIEQRNLEWDPIKQTNITFSIQ